MRPVPIPDNALWRGAKRVVMAGPSGDLTDDTIRPVETIVDQSPALGGPVFTVLCAPEADDLARLADGALVAVSFYGAMPPFCVDILGPRHKEAT